MVMGRMLIGRERWSEQGGSAVTEEGSGQLVRWPEVDSADGVGGVRSDVIGRREGRRGRGLRRRRGQLRRRRGLLFRRARYHAGDCCSGGADGGWGHRIGLREKTEELSVWTQK